MICCMPKLSDEVSEENEILRACYRVGGIEQTRGETSYRERNHQQLKAKRGGKGKGLKRNFFRFILFLY